MELVPVPRTDDIKVLAKWLDDLYEYLHHPDVGKILLAELDADPGEPAAGHAILYLKDNGGKTTLYVRFNNNGGAADIVELAAET
jgi:hypothetical protein